MATEIPLNTWMMHKQSQNIFKVVAVKALHVHTVDLDDGRQGFANKYLLAEGIRRGHYVIDQKGQS